jgi:hypothetical protein
MDAGLSWEHISTMRTVWSPSSTTLQLVLKSSNVSSNSNQDHADGNVECRGADASERPLVVVAVHCNAVC